MSDLDALASTHRANIRDYHESKDSESAASKLGREGLVLLYGVGGEALDTLTNPLSKAPDVAMSATFGLGMRVLSKAGAPGKVVAAGFAVGAGLKTAYDMATSDKWSKFSDAMSDTWHSSRNFDKAVLATKDSVGSLAVDLAIGSATYKLLGLSGRTAERPRSNISVPSKPGNTTSLEASVARKAVATDRKAMHAASRGLDGSGLPVWEPTTPPPVHLAEALSKATLERQSSLFQNSIGSIRVKGHKFGLAKDGEPTGTAWYVGNGRFVSNQHTLDFCSPDIEVMMPNGRSIMTRLVGKNPIDDIAALQVKPDHIADLANTPAIKIARAEELATGSPASAYGYPRSLQDIGAKPVLAAAPGNMEGNFTGSVSRTLSSWHIPTTPTSWWSLFMRTESGFSGGPVLNVADQAIGMVAAGEGNGTAIIPGKNILGFLERLDGPIKPVPLSDAAERLGMSTQGIWEKIRARELSVIEDPDLGFLVYLKPPS